MISYFCSQLVKMENADMVGVLLSLLHTWCLIGQNTADNANGPNMIVEFIFANEQVMEAIEECTTKFAGRFRREASELLQLLNLNE